VSSKRNKSVALALEMSKASVQNVSSALSTISTTSIDKYDKYKNSEINRERWNLILNYLKDDVKKYLTPWYNYEERLDKLELQGTTPQAVGKFMAHQNWSTAFSIGGLFAYFLDVLLGVKKGGQSACMPPHCGKCDLITRQLFEPSTGHDGKPTYDCPTCRPAQVRLMNRLAETRTSNILEFPMGIKELAGAPNSLNFDSAFKSVNE